VRQRASVEAHGDYRLRPTAIAPGRHQAAPAGCLVVALSRLNRLVVATQSTRAASCFSSKCLAAWSHTSSGTASARSASRVIDSARAKAARSASVKSSVSRHGR
jgi:hypothetical protein